MLNHVLEILKSHCFVDFHQPILLGVSGGSDSLCMLYLMHEAGIPVMVAHYNHRLRLEADREAKMVERWVEALGLPFYYAEREESSYINEELARQKRYEFLFKIAQQEKAQAVAVAHNADDQVETILLHLMRGSGLTGLKGMAFYSLPNAWSREIALIRPLLSTWRREIDEFIEARGLSPNIDRSNFDVSILRNRIRQELVPHLQTYSPQIKRLLCQTAELLNDEEMFIETWVDRAWKDCYIKKDRDQVELALDQFKKQAVNIQRRLVRRAISMLIPSLRDIDFGIVDRFITLSGRKKNYWNADLGEKLYFSKVDNRMIISKGELHLFGDFPRIAKGAIIPVQLPGTIKISPHWLLECHTVTLDNNSRKEIESNCNPYRIWLDLDKVDKPLVLRTRKTGDTFSPLGMEGHHIKLTDFMINEKIPCSFRDNWPLLAAGDDIVWVTGYHIANQFRVTKESKRAINISFNCDLNQIEK